MQLEHRDWTCVPVAECVNGGRIQNVAWFIQGVRCYCLGSQQQKKPWCHLFIESVGVGEEG